MEKLNKVLGDIIDHTRIEILATWPKVVGHQIYEKTEVVNIENGNLIVGVSDVQWLNQLIFMRKEILKKMNQNLRTTKIKRITFVIRKPTKNSPIQREFNLHTKIDLSKIRLTQEEKNSIKEVGKEVKDLRLRKKLQKYYETVLKLRKIGEEK